MSSLKMHIAISEKVKRELNYSNLFILGAVLPDVFKLIVNERTERTSTHFEINKFIDLDKYLSAQDDLTNELTLGYYAHLIEDKIWLESYINKKYIKLKEYSDEKLYNDYAFVDNFMYKKLNLNTQNIRKILLENIDTIDVKSINLMNCKNENLINNKNVKQKLKEVWQDYKSDNHNYFFTIHDAEEYYELASRKIKEYIKKIQTI